MGTPRRMVVPQKELSMVEGTYEDTRIRVLLGPGVSGEFKVDAGLRQGNVLSPLYL